MRKHHIKLVQARKYPSVLHKLSPVTSLLFTRACHLFISAQVECKFKSTEERAADFERLRSGCIYVRRTLSEIHLNRSRIPGERATTPIDVVRNLSTCRQRTLCFGTHVKYL